MRLRISVFRRVVGCLCLEERRMSLEMVGKSKEGRWMSSQAILE